MLYARLNPVPGNNVLPAEIADFYIRVSFVTFIISSDRSSSRNGVPLSIICPQGRNFFKIFTQHHATNKQTIQTKFQGREATYMKAYKPFAYISRL